MTFLLKGINNFICTSCTLIVLVANLKCNIISFMSGLKFSSRTDSLEFREILLDSTALCFVLMCLFMFLTALNNWPHSGHFTFAWSCWCFSCWWLFKKDLGFSLHPPAMHIHTPSLAEALCILLTWSFMYAFELVLYLQSSQEKYCSSSSNLWLRTPPPQQGSGDALN